MKTSTNNIVLIVGNTAWDGKRAYTDPTASIPILTALLKEDFNLSVIDANGQNYTKEQTKALILESKAEAVLVTALSVEWHTCYHEVARLGKECGCKVMMGGGISNCIR